MRTRHSLKFRISLVISLLTGAVLATIIVGASLLITDVARRHMATKETVFARFVEDLGRDALLSRDYATLQIFLRGLLSDPEVRHLSVANHQGVVVASTDPVEIGQRLAADKNSRTLSRHIDITNASGKLGEVSLEFSYASVEQLKQKVTLFSIIAAFLAAGISCLCGSVIGGLLTRRLERLKNAVQHFGAGEFDYRLDQNGDDEIALLAGTFNEMAGRIKIMLDELRAQSLQLEQVNSELEDRVVERTAQLEAANRELESFSYSVSHDLQAPLRHIKGFSQCLREDYADRFDAAGQDLIRRIGGASRRMEELIEVLLKFSQLSQAEIRKERIDFSQLARSIIAMFRESEPGRLASVLIADGIYGWGDRMLLDIVMQNLLGNAWKFTAGRADAVIEFGKAVRDGKRTYYVRDNGIGFDMADEERLFGVFQRLQPAGEFPGSGIGLATVKRIIVRHGGTIRAEGSIGSGATFFFSLPEGKEETPAAETR